MRGVTTKKTKFGKITTIEVGELDPWMKLTAKQLRRKPDCVFCGKLFTARSRVVPSLTYRDVYFHYVCFNKAFLSTHSDVINYVSQATGEDNPLLKALKGKFPASDKNYAGGFVIKIKPEE